MTTIVTSKLERRAAYEPVYDVDPRTGASIEVFYADEVLAKSFGTRSGWFWWSCRHDFLLEDPPTGLFATSYAAYRNVTSLWMLTFNAESFGRRRRACAARECETAPRKARQ
jgi:hypothetical protein